MANTEWELAESGSADTEWELADDQPYTPDMSAATPNLRRDVGIIGTAASRVVTGPGQVMTALGELLGIPGASVEDYTAAVNDLERKVQGGGQLNDREKAALNVWEFVTAAAVPAGPKVAGPTSKLLPTLGQGTAAGAAGGALTFDPTATTPGQALTSTAAGAGLGGGAGMLFGAYPAVRNFAFREFRADPLPQQAGELAQIQRSAITRDLPLSNAQRTGRYEAEVQEARVAGSLAKDFYNQQLEALSRRWQSLQRPGKTAGDIGVDARNALSATEARMQAEASKRYGSSVDEAIALAQRDPSYNYGVPARNIQAFAEGKEDLIGALSSLLDSGPTKHKAALQEILGRVQQGDGNLSMVDMIRLHQVSTSLSAPIYKLQKTGQALSPQQQDAVRLGKELRRAVEGDVETLSARIKAAREGNTAVTTPGGNAMPRGGEMDQVGKFNDAAWARFEQGRADYREFINARDSLEATAFSQAFRSSPKEPEKAWREFLQKSPEEQARAANILREHAPEALEELKKWKIRDVSQRMFDLTKEGAASPISVDNFINELTSGNRIAGEMLWSTAEKNNIRSVISYLRTIQNKAPVRAVPTDPQSAAMALASQSSAFLMRLAYQAVAMGKAEKLFFTPEGRNALRTLATTSDPRKGAYIQALGWLQAQAMQGEPSAETTEEFAVAP